MTCEEMANGWDFQMYGLDDSAHNFVLRDSMILEVGTSRLGVYYVSLSKF